MKLNAPKVVTWWIAVIVAVLGIVGYILFAAGVVKADWLMTLSFWIEVLAVVILAAATALAKL